MEPERDLGLFPLDSVLLPGERMPLHIFEPRYRQLVADSVLDEEPFVLVRAGEERMASVGCAGRFVALVRRFEDGRMNIVAEGERAVEIGEQTEGRWYLSARVQALADAEAAPDGELLGRAESLFRELTGVEGELPVPGGVPRSYGLAGRLEMPDDAKQQLLESRSEDERLTLLADLLESAREGAAHARLAAERAQGNGKVVAP